MAGKRLDFDLDFLDKPTQSKKTTEHKKVEKENGLEDIQRKVNWKPLLIIGGVILFFIIIASDPSDNTTTSTTSAANTEEFVTLGEYSCSKSDARQADLLRPSESEGSMLEAEEATLVRQKRQIDNTIVDEYSEYSVDNYNSTVDRYNAKREAYNDDLDTYNSEIDEYNNFLEANCTRR